MTMTATQTTSALGGVVRRREDPALIQGRGKYVDDIAPVGTLHVAFARSPYANARINSIDTTAAKNAEGVAAVVNDNVISTFDVRQRATLLLVSAGLDRTPEMQQRARAQALRDLVDERLQLEEARRYEITVTQDEDTESFTLSNCQ